MSNVVNIGESIQKIRSDLRQKGLCLICKKPVLDPFGRRYRFVHTHFKCWFRTQSKEFQDQFNIE